MRNFAILATAAICGWATVALLGIKAGGGCYFTHCFLIFSIPRWWG